MFDEATGLENPYFRTKHDSEGLVRQKCKVPWRIYRPGIVVGDSKTGEIDKIDGPYYFFKLIQKMRRAMPAWMPMIGLEGSRLNIVPVDYVVKALDHISHLPRQDGKCFHLTDPKPLRIGEVLNLFADAAHAPQMSMRVDARLFNYIPAVVKQGLMMLPPVRRIYREVLKDLGMPPDVLKFINYPTKFDSRETQKLLRKNGITVPRLDDYAWRLWDYWERHLDPDLFIDRSLRGHVAGKVVVVTGGSSGIGHATAVMMGRAGARVAIVARDKNKLADAVREIEEEGGEAMPFSADLADMDACDNVLKQIFSSMGDIDILVNNARLRTRHAAELLRQFTPDHGCPAGDGKETAWPHHQYFIDRRAVQCTAFFSLRGVESRVGRFLALRVFRIQRHGRSLHHHQHAPGQDADDRTDEDLRKCSDHQSG
jgi:nucleoside-diphosphate-sugar epimerase